MADLAVGMRKLSSTRSRIVAPESREIRYQVIRPFRLALAGVVAEEEIETLVENVAGVGLRLSAHGGAEVIVKAAAPERKGRRTPLASSAAAHRFG